MKINKLKKHKIAAIAGLLAAVGISANAQSLLHYYYSAGGASVTADQVGTANGTVYGGTLSGGANGYLITDGTGGGLSGGVPTMGMQLDASSVSGVSSAFTISMWFQATGNAYTSFLYAFSDGTSGNMLASLAVDGGYPYPPHAYARVGGATIGTELWGNGFNNGVGGSWTDNGTLHQEVLTYDGSTWSMYMDNQLAASGSLSGFDLSLLQNVDVAGGSPWGVGDRSFNGNTYSFGIIDGALSGSQVASIYGLGQDATASAISSAIAPVPEPSTLALSVIGGLTVLVMRHRSRR
jgi:hypothetical protein